MILVQTGSEKLDTNEHSGMIYGFNEGTLSVGHVGVYVPGSLKIE